MIQRLCIFLIRIYRWGISPFKRQSCRFEPSCSLYAIHAIEYHGVIKGITLAVKRLLRCHPFSKTHGYDPIPPSNRMKHP